MTLLFPYISAHTPSPAPSEGELQDWRIFSLVVGRFVGTWPREKGERWVAAGVAWLVGVDGREWGREGTLPLVRARDPLPKGCPDRAAPRPGLCSSNPFWRRARLWAADLLGCGSASPRRQPPPGSSQSLTAPGEAGGLLSQVPGVAGRVVGSDEQFLSQILPGELLKVGSFPYIFFFPFFFF